MLIHIGSDYLINAKNIVGIFDLDKTTSSPWTRDFLALGEKEATVINAADDIPRSFIVLEEDGEKRVYLIQLTVSTLMKRIKSAGKSLDIIL